MVALDPVPPSRLGTAILVVVPQSSPTGTCRGDSAQNESRLMGEGNSVRMMPARAVPLPRPVAGPGAKEDLVVAIQTSATRPAARTREWGPMRSGPSAAVSVGKTADKRERADR